MSLKLLAPKFFQHFPDTYNILESALDGSCADLNKQHIFYVLFSAAYSLKNEQIVNLCIKQARVLFEDVSLEEVYCAVIESAKYCTMANANVIDIAQFKPSVFELIKSKKFDKNNFLFASLAASIIFSSSTVSQQLIAILEEDVMTKSATHAIVEVIAGIRSLHELMKLNTIRTYDFIAREENF